MSEGQPCQHAASRGAAGADTESGMLRRVARRLLYLSCWSTAPLPECRSRDAGMPRDKLHSPLPTGQHPSRSRSQQVDNDQVPTGPGLTNCQSRKTRHAMMAGRHIGNSHQTTDAVRTDASTCNQPAMDTSMPSSHCLRVEQQQQRRCYETLPLQAKEGRRQQQEQQQHGQRAGCGVSSRSSHESGSGTGCHIPTGAGQATALQPNLVQQRRGSSICSHLAFSSSSSQAWTDASALPYIYTDLLEQPAGLLVQRVSVQAAELQLQAANAKLTRAQHALVPEYTATQHWHSTTQLRLPEACHEHSSSFATADLQRDDLPCDSGNAAADGFAAGHSSLASPWDAQVAAASHSSAPVRISILQGQPQAECNLSAGTSRAMPGTLEPSSPVHSRASQVRGKSAELCGTLSRPALGRTTRQSACGTLLQVPAEHTHAARTLASGVASPLASLLHVQQAAWQARSERRSRHLQSLCDLQRRRQSSRASFSTSNATDSVWLAGGDGSDADEDAALLRHLVSRESSAAACQLIAEALNDMPPAGSPSRAAFADGARSAADAGAQRHVLAALGLSVRCSSSSSGSSGSAMALDAACAMAALEVFGADDELDLYLNLELGVDVTLDENDSIVGSGASSMVVRGRYQGRQVAVKMLSADRDGSSVAHCHAEAFKREVEVLCLYRHPNIVKFHGACLAPPSVFIVEELIERSLAQLIHGQSASHAGAPRPSTWAAGKPPLLPLRRVLEIGLDIACALAYLHPSVVHRDLKPSNVLISPSGTAKLSDFGLACIHDQPPHTRPAAAAPAGTPLYMAPEALVRGAHVTDRVDVYAFGVLMCEMLTGCLPLQAAAQELPPRTAPAEGAGAAVAEHGADQPRAPLRGGAAPPGGVGVHLLPAMPSARIPPHLHSLCAMCLHPSPGSRPPASVVVCSLQGMLASERADEGCSVPDSPPHAL
mmetsp:Transcript_29766/g.88102  ORF Transcript_29766/g.88102 Transcript_29766/m.88102 type:complete len:943 (-) Transcript_29766:1290-4118(-)